MMSFIKSIHSSLAYLVLAGLIISAIIFLYKRFSGKEFGPSDKLLALSTLIFSHLQLVFGLILYFFGDMGYQLLKVEGVMKNPAMRLYAVEHISVNIIAIALITIGYSRSKRATANKSRFSNLGYFYLAGLVLILSRIPWDNWLQ